jgi:hypothetical protein
LHKVYKDRPNCLAIAELESNVCIDDLKERVEKENFKLKLAGHVRLLFIISIVILFAALVIMEYIYSIAYIEFFFAVPFLAVPFFYIFVRPFLGTNINSSELIAYHLSEIARKLDSTIINANKEKILKGLSEIIKESRLIYFHLDAYSPQEIRNKRAPFTAETVQFLNDLDSICKKISYIVKHETEFDLDSLQLSLYRLSIYLCEGHNSITNVECHSREIYDELSEFPEDDSFAGSKFEEFKITFLDAWNSSFWVRFLISISFLLIPYYFLFYPNHLWFIVILATAIIAWATQYGQ